MTSHAPWSIRPAQLADIDATFDVRGATRQSAIPRERLAQLGITPASVAEAMRGDTYRSWLCEADGAIVGFCNADAATGEVVVLAVRTGFEGTGIGRALLAAAVAYLQARQCPRIWLMAGADPALRSHGFYRGLGWRPTGRTDARGDEELEFRRSLPAA
jgi:ribosomal protein S18 acetylase RimI-like enzyme